jgi:UDP-N-acetyl-2-amino-2-deoxyglucuronate dehydrogenase
MRLKTIRVGIIGCGVIGPTHAESYLQQSNVELTWACDLDAGKTKALAEKYGIANTSTDYNELLNDSTLDCVSVCTDHASHVPIVVAALKHGKHVLCEKALVANRKGLDAMSAAHAAHPEVIFGAVSQHRFEAVNRLLRQYIEEGVLGTLLTASVQVRCLRTNAYYEADAWRGTWAEEGGSVLINQAIHFIDSLVWITGGISRLCGTHSNLTHHGVIETEDTAVAAICFRNGALGTIEATSSSNLTWDHTLCFCGDAGTIEMRDDKPLRVAFNDKALQKRVETELRDAKENPGVSAGKSYYGGGHTGQIADFVEAIRDSRQPFVTASDIQHTVNVVLGIYESDSSGGWVSVA